MAGNFRRCKFRISAHRIKFLWFQFCMLELLDHACAIQYRPTAQLGDLSPGLCAFLTSVTVEGHTY